MVIVKEPDNYKNKWNSLFLNDQPIYLEVGMGKGDFIIKMAQEYPNINFIGIEKYTSVIVRAVKKLEGIDLPNLRLINGDANNLGSYFGHEISRIYLNFSDPWPKKRNAKRRLTSEYYLSIYDEIFKSKGEILQKTDNEGLFLSSILSLSQHGYVFNDMAFDLWATDKVYAETEYEHKFKNMGVKIKYLNASLDISKLK